MEKEESPSVSPDAAAPHPPRMPYDADQIDELRKRLYARGNTSDTQSVRHAIPPRTPVVSERAPQSSPKPPEPRPYSAPQVSNAPAYVPPAPPSDTIDTMARNTARNTFRKKIALAGVIFFAFALFISSVLLFWGGNTVSGENISITTSGGNAVGGGEIYEFQVAIANQNAVPIQSATLIIDYPDGTHAADDPDKELGLERQSLESIQSGEMVNVPQRVRIYGEENEIKEIQLWIEYRVGGSNATFEKHAEPLKLTVTTSPVLLRFEEAKSISSGKEVEMKLVVESNSQTPLTDLVLKISYPEGFDFTDSDPDTLSGEDTWSIDELDPKEKKTITFRGLLTGGESDVRRFGAAIGVPKGDNQNSLASQLATANAEITIDQPSLGVDVVINGSPSETVAIDSETKANVEIEYENTLGSSIRDGKVIVTLSGNALSDYRVSTFGDYDEAKHTITWDADTDGELDEILPGRSVRMLFSLEPKNIIRRTPEVRMEVAIEGSRTSQDRKEQSVQGSATRTLKIEGTPELSSKTNFTEGPFSNTGPVPPQVGEATEYTYLMTARAGVNDMTGAEVTAILPPWVEWLDTVTANDTVTFNPTTRAMKWAIGDINAREEASVGIQVSVTPEENHAGEIITILETQRFRATDRFTGTTVRTETSALTTSLEGSSSSGRVQD